jgi:hypothetical protein
MRHLLWILVAALLVADYQQQQHPFPQRVSTREAYRQLKYGDTWMRVYLQTGRTLVLIPPKGWVEVTGYSLPSPGVGCGATPGGMPIFAGCQYVKARAPQ